MTVKCNNLINAYEVIALLGEVFINSICEPNAEKRKLPLSLIFVMTFKNFSKMRFSFQSE